MTNFEFIMIRCVTGTAEPNVMRDFVHRMNIVKQRLAQDENWYMAITRPFSRVCRHERSLTFDGQGYIGMYEILDKVPQIRTVFMESNLHEILSALLFVGRFQMAYRDYTVGTERRCGLFIRAFNGHSVELDPTQCYLRRITLDDVRSLHPVVHTTPTSNMESITRWGLTPGGTNPARTSGRQAVHFMCFRVAEVYDFEPGMLNRLSHVRAHHGQPFTACILTWHQH